MKIQLRVVHGEGERTPRRRAEDRKHLSVVGEPPERLARMTVHYIATSMGNVEQAQATRVGAIGLTGFGILLVVSLALAMVALA